MIVGIDNLIQVVEDNKIENWEVRSSLNDTNSIQMRTNEQSQTQAEKIKLLRDVMSNNYGKFYLIGYKTPEQLKGRITIEFMIKQEIDSPSRAVSGVVAPLTPPSMDGYMKESEVTKTVENAQLKYQLKDLESKVATLEKEKKELQSPMNDFFRNLSPIVGAIATNLLKGKSPVAIGELSSGESQQQQESEGELQCASQEEYDALQNALERWQKIDGDCFLLICKIADLAENDPSTYNMAKTMLMSK